VGAQSAERSGYQVLTSTSWYAENVRRAFDPSIIERDKPREHGPDEQMNYIYMIRCEDNSLYTGVTKDLYRRMDAHFYGKKEGAKYTRSRKPVWLCMVWTTSRWQDACRLEYLIKRFTKRQKENLLSDPSKLQTIFREHRDDDTFACEVCRQSQNYPIFLKDFLSKSE